MTGTSDRRADSIRASSAWEATRTSISADACAGTTLVVVPPSNDADVDGGARGQVLQVLEFQDLVGELDDRVSSLLGCHAGVGGLAFDLEMEPAHALPRGLEPAVGQGRLEHQRISTINCQLLDEPARRGAADFLVRSEQHPDGPAASACPCFLSCSMTARKMTRLAFMSKTPGP